MNRTRIKFMSESFGLEPKMLSMNDDYLQKRLTSMHNHHAGVGHVVGSTCTFKRVRWPVRLIDTVAFPRGAKNMTHVLMVSDSDHRLENFNFDPNDGDPDNQPSRLLKIVACLLLMLTVCRKFTGWYVRGTNPFFFLLFNFYDRSIDL